MKKILLLAIFATTLNGIIAKEKLMKQINDEKTISFNKIILYVKTNSCSKTFDFYKNGVGLNVIYTTKNHGWSEFNIKDTSLCIHADEFDDYSALTRTGTFIVLNIKSMEELKKVRKRMLPVCKLVDKKEPIAANEITNIYLSNSKKFYWFRAGDPAGNTIQFEWAIKNNIGSGKNAKQL